MVLDFITCCPALWQRVPPFVDVDMMAALSEGRGATRISTRLSLLLHWRHEPCATHGQAKPPWAQRVFAGGDLFRLGEIPFKHGFDLLRERKILNQRDDFEIQPE